MRASVLWGVLIVCSLAGRGVGAEELHILDVEDPRTLERLQLSTEFSAGAFEQPDDSKLISFPRARLALGLGSSAEFVLDYELRTLTDSSRYKDGAFEPGDLKVKLKWSPVECGPGRIGFLVSTKLPNADDSRGVGSDETDWEGRVLLGHDFGDWEVSVNLGARLQGDPREDQSVDAFFVYGLGARYRLDDDWSILAEVQGGLGSEDSDEVAEGELGTPWLQAKLGVQGPLFSSGWQWGLTAGGGITADSPDWNVMAVVGRTWGGEEEEGEAACGASVAGEDRVYEYLPLQTSASQVLCEGAWHAAVEFRGREQADESELYELPKVTVSYGLGGVADVSVSSSVRWLEDSRAYGSHVGSGDVALEVKLAPWEFAIGRPGLMVFTKLPGAPESKGLGTGELDFVAKALWTSELGAWRLHANAGLAILSKPTSDRAQNDYFVFGLAADYHLLEALLLVAEIEGAYGSKVAENIAEGFLGEKDVEARLGLSGVIFDDWNWGVSGSVGLTGDSPDWGFTAGFARTWD